MRYDDWYKWTPFAPRACAERLPDASPADERRARARVTQGLPSLTLTPTIGVAWFPLATGTQWPEGGIASVKARVAGSTTPLGQRVAAKLQALLDLTSAPRLLLEATHSTGIETEADLEIRGQSLEYAALVAAVSMLLYEPPRRAPLVSGRLGEMTGTLDAVRFIPQKRAAILRELGPRTDLHQHEIDADAVSARDALVPLFGEDWAERLRARLELPVHQRVQNAWALYRQGDRVNAEATLVEDDVPELAAYPASRIQNAWLRAALAMHRAAPDTAEHYAEIERLVQRERALGQHLVRELDAFIGIAEIDAGRPKDARMRLQVARDKLLRSAPDLEFAPETQWVWAHISVQGSLHRACVFGGDFAVARAALEASLASSVWLPGERARILGDLAEVHRREGDLDRARARLEEAHAAIADTHAESRELTLAYQRLYRRRARIDTAPVPRPESVNLHDPREALYLEWLAQGEPARLFARVAEIREVQPAIMTQFAALSLLLGVGARALREHPEVPQPWVEDVVTALCAVSPDEEVKACARGVPAGDFRFGAWAGY